MRVLQIRRCAVMNMKYFRQLLLAVPRRDVLNCFFTNVAANGDPRVWPA